MPRNPSTGVYSKPAGTTPSVGQIIDPVPWNALTTDLGNEITNSLPRDGSAPMVAPLKAASGTVSAPGVGFASNPQTGIYLKGGGLLGFTQNGVDVSFDQAMIYAAKSGDYTALASDNNAVHRFTAAAIVTLTAAATLGANWHYMIIADGGDVTIDPNGAETIDGAATRIIPNGSSVFIVCNGSAFFTDRKLQPFATLASAATTDLGTVGSQNVTISGTTTISSFGTVPAGTFRRLVFSGILTLTHNATSLILPNNGSNITTAAGDSLEAISLGSGNWRVTEYQKADPFDVKAWVNFNGTGVVAIRASKNVSSITDNGTGDYTVNFTTALSDANYSVALAGPSGNGRSVFLYDGSFISFNATMTVSGFRVGFATNTGVFGDPAYLTAIVTR